MVRFTVLNLGEHTIDNMQVSGPFREIVMEMAKTFVAGFQRTPEADIDLDFAQYVIQMSGGQGQILEHRPNAPGSVH